MTVCSGSATSDGDAARPRITLDSLVKSLLLSELAEGMMMRWLSDGQI